MMTIRAIMVAVGLAAMLSAPGARADDDAPQGSALHQKGCVRCHDDGVYKREDRFVKSRDSLDAQVRRCEQAERLHWFDDEISAVVDYLNQSYYRFK